MVVAVALLSTVLAAPPAEARKYPKIFGSIELFSTKTQRFPKWLTMLDRFQNGTKLCESSTCTTKGWKEFIAELQGKDLATQLREVNRAFNAHRYILDINNWGEDDYWDTPYQFLKKDGDCEDYVLLKRRMLIQAGWPRQALLITVVRDQRGDGHAVLTVKTDKGEFVLDNQNEEVLLWSETSYRFVKRQSQSDPNVWVALGDNRPAVLTATSR